MWTSHVRIDVVVDKSARDVCAGGQGGRLCVCLGAQGGGGSGSG